MWNLIIRGVRLVFLPFQLEYIMKKKSSFFSKKKLQHQQEQALNQILSGIPVGEKVKSSDLFRAALIDLKAWNVSICALRSFLNTALLSLQKTDGPNPHHPD